MGLAFTRWLGGQGGEAAKTLVLQPITPPINIPMANPPYNLVPTCLEAWQEKKRNLCR